MFWLQAKHSSHVSRWVPWSGIFYTRNLSTPLDSIPLSRLSAESTLNKNYFLYYRLYTITRTMQKKQRGAWKMLSYAHSSVWPSVTKVMHAGSSAGQDWAECSPTLAVKVPLFTLRSWGRRNKNKVEIGEPRSQGLGSQHIPPGTGYSSEMRWPSCCWCVYPGVNS